MSRHRAHVTTVYLSGFLQGLVGVAFPASAVVLLGYGLSNAQYGSLFVPQMTLAALGAAFGGPLMERLGARRALSLGTALMGLSQAALAATGLGGGAWAYPLALLGTSLLGLGAGVLAGPSNAYPQVLFPRRAESAVVALHTIIGLGLALCPLLAAAALEGGAWIAFPLLLLALHAVVALAIEREELPRPEPDHEGRPPARPARHTALWLFLAIAFLYGSTEQLFGNWGIVFLVDERGLSPAAAGAAAAAFWAAVACGRVGVVALLLRLPPGPVLPVLTGLMALGALLVPLVQGAGLALALFALAGLGCGAVFPLSVGLASRRFPSHRAWVSSLAFAALVSGLGVGSFAAGLLRSALPLASIYRLGALAPALAGVLALVALRESRRAHAVV